MFVEIIKEPYISAAAPQGLLLPADLHTGRRVMKQASLEIHHCGEQRRFTPSLLLLLPLPPPLLLSPFFFLKFLFFFLSRSFGLLNALYYSWVQTQHKPDELASCQTWAPTSWLRLSFLSVFCSRLAVASWLNWKFTVALFVSRRAKLTSKLTLLAVLCFLFLAFQENIRFTFSLIWYLCVDGRTLKLGHVSLVQYWSRIVSLPLSICLPFYTDECFNSLLIAFILDTFYFLKVQHSTYF